MNGHETARERMALAAAGALAPNELTDFTGHLSRCAECAAEFESWCTMTVALRRLPRPEVTPGLAHRACLLVARNAGRQSENRWNETMAAVLGLYAWTVSAMAWVIGRILGGGALSLLDTGFVNAFLWLSATTVFGWITAGLAAVLIGRRRLVRRMI